MYFFIKIHFIDNKIFYIYNSENGVKHQLIWPLFSLFKKVWFVLPLHNYLHVIIV